MAAPIKKDTLYVDVEDDITAIIDRVNSSTSKIVALVLPKRAHMLHSSVNMRLLKRAADTGKKQLVLITNEETILALAGAVSVYTATSLTSKPVIPKNSLEVSDEVVSIDAPEESDEPALDESKPIGELAAAAAVGATVAAAHKDNEVIELDDDEASDAPEKSDSKKEKKDRKLKVPNFDSFRNKLFAGIGVVIGLLVLGFFAFFVWPRATIVIKQRPKKCQVVSRLSQILPSKKSMKKRIFCPRRSKRLSRPTSKQLYRLGKKISVTEQKVLYHW